MTPDQVRQYREEEAAVLRAQQGDQRSLERLLRSYEIMVRARSAVYYLAGGEREDMDQVARLGVFEAIQCWRPDKGRFAAMVEMVVRRRVFQAVKMALRVKHAPLNDAEPFCFSIAGAEDETWRENPRLPVSSPDAPCEAALERDALRRWQEAFRVLLSEREATVARLFAAGETYPEIAARLGITYKAVDNARMRINRRRAQIWAYVEGEVDEQEDGDERRL